METIGKRLEALRKKSALNQAKASKAAGIAQSFLSEIENDKKGFGADTLMRFSDMYSTTPEYIMRGNGLADSVEQEERVQELVSLFQGLSDDSQLIILKMVKGASDLAKPSGSDRQSDKRQIAA